MRAQMMRAQNQLGSNDGLLKEMHKYFRNSFFYMSTTQVFI